jgi:hypothetical protein
MENLEIIKKKRKSLTFPEKFEVICFYDLNSSSMNFTQISRALDLPRPSLDNILKDRILIETVVSNKIYNTKRKRLRDSSFPLLDRCLLVWLNCIGDNPESGIIVNNDSLKVAAENFQTLLGDNKITISDQFLQKWRNRYDIRSYIISGESSSADLNSFEKWKKMIPEILSKYEPKNIFNLDETALFRKMMPNRGYLIKGKSTFGIKESKERFTILLAVNLCGEKLKPVVLGKAKHPTSFPKFIIQKNFIISLP